MSEMVHVVMAAGTDMDTHVVMVLVSDMDRLATVVIE